MNAGQNNEPYNLSSEQLKETDNNYEHIFM